ncbi:hypothetical protein MNBD_GAMMA01-1340 [hydrothermal vent metagenome]|uniref:Right handed beta helix domain-containing protein n=1 Tax=hydrothermal vent metagenome TaxID=652676 RepID=A0A3B0W2Y4_9ZZZZ
MAVIPKSIGTIGRDYSSMTLWGADLDDTGIYASGDDALGEVYNDSAFDEGLTINGGAVAGLNSVKLTVPLSDRHDGTAGTGARMVGSTSRILTLATPSGFDSNYIVEWLEWDKNNYADEAVTTFGSNFGDVPVIRNMLIHDANGGDSYLGLVSAGARDLQVVRCIVYNLTRSTGLDVRGLNIDADQASGGLYNNIIWNVKNPGAGNSSGISVLANSVNSTVKNNISIGTTADGVGIATDYNFGGTNPDSDYNLSSDDTADDGGGANNLINGIAADQFISTVDGIEDLHLKSGADAIDTGVDLITTPVGVNIDINGRDVDSEGDTWDMGAHEFVEAGGATVKSNPLCGSIGGLLMGPIG